MVKQELDFDVICRIDNFRCYSNINGLRLLDGSYLERLITHFLKNKNFITTNGVLDFKELITVLEVNTVEGVKNIFTRLEDIKVLSFQKVGKYHDHKYMVIINPEYCKFFFLDREQQ
ncbi:hypothetical protein KC717_03815 [Candidatus Dojkabacteria bacterium]|uniref:Uncharacterized protein n=1 Tax=Candidatus Dojkabacteria bacterium TaxID=2099670 RepID=A0A955RKD0_9BACT|nr:hypothetical protein [Candidatus Dojkabacteria bacterium]